eukprot:CAMPEP_0116082428 /NCGR_PEP_ID=MMETSP0327-20121206/2729_1 /TAXON_ID=44447 /ORGANISM="Pseudo-nitzschia delicatissima, Strain B596" /LENGTH=402 /DNA_ID=CAMNT_0003573237 /DNA_START=92 /DNA_END=1297 /DNA_ORIENTATION=+
MAMTITQNPVQEIISTTHFHLQFDGCFRPPRDPGFPTIPHRTAVCAACIGMAIHSNAKDNNDDSKVIQPLAVGARQVPVSIETTSQHAEYEGLLMGLEWLTEFLSNEKARSNLDETPKIILSIKGDCKTVIDQLTGRSNPRKLEGLHRRAQDLVQELQQIDHRFQIEFEISHIPRSQNLISDGLCNNLMSIVDATSWMHSLNQLEKAANQTTLEQQQQQQQSLSLSTVFESAVRTTKVSLRPVLYEMAANLAFDTNNYALLIQIGEQMVEEESSLQGSGKSNSMGMSIRKIGVVYQFIGWERLKNAKKIKFLQRKYRVLLKDYNDHISNIDETTTKFPSWPKDENCGKDSQQPINQRPQDLGHVTKGEWDALPGVWKPILEEWFVSARHGEEEEVTFSAPVW